MRVFGCTSIKALVKIVQKSSHKLTEENTSFFETKIAFFSVKQEKKLNIADDIDRNIMNSLKH